MRNSPLVGEVTSWPGTACATMVASSVRPDAATALPPAAYVICTRLESPPDVIQEATPVVGVHESNPSALSSVTQLASAHDKKTDVVLKRFAAVGWVLGPEPRVLVLLK